MKLATGLISITFILSSTAWSKGEDFFAVSRSLGALSQVIGQKTKVAGVDEKPKTVTPDTAKVTRNLEDDLQTCLTTEVSPAEIVEIDHDGTTMKMKKYHVIVDGPNCPVVMESKMDTKQVNDEELVGDFSVSLILNHPDYINKYNLKQVQITGHMTTRIQQVGDILKTYVEAQMIGSGESTVIGKFSQDMKMSFAIDINPMTFDMTILAENSAQIQYGTVNDKLYSRMKMSGFAGMGQNEQVYTLNGADISATDYQKYSEGFVIPGVVEEEDPNSPDAKVTSSCDFAVYEKSKVTAEDLKMGMQKALLPKSGLVASGHATGQNMKQTFSYNGKTYTHELTFDKDWINYGGSFLTGPDRTSLYVIYQDQVPQTTESDEFTVGLVCKPLSSVP